MVTVVLFIYPVFRCPVFKWHSHTRPFGDQTTFDHLNTRLVWYTDPNCKGKLTWIDNTNVSSTLDEVVQEAIFEVRISRKEFVNENDVVSRVVGSGFLLPQQSWNNRT